MSHDVNKQLVKHLKIIIKLISIKIRAMNDAIGGTKRP